MVLLAGEIGLSYESGSLFIEGNHFILVDPPFTFLSFLKGGYARLCMPYQKEAISILILTRGMILKSSNFLNIKLETK